MKKISALSLSFALLILALAWGSVTLLPQTGYYPHLAISSSDGVSVDFYMDGHDEKSSCDKMLSVMQSTAQAGCPACKLDAQCSRGPSEFHRLALGSRPLESASLRLVNGVLLVRTRNTGETLPTCNLIRMQMKNAASPPCVPPKMARTKKSS